MRRIRVELTCDLCTEPATGTTLLGVDARTAEVDLCDAHSAELLGPLLDLLNRGRGPQTAAEGEEWVYPCPLCDAYTGPSRGMHQHLSRAHDMKDRAARAELIGAL